MDNKAQGIMERIILLIPLTIILYIVFVVLNPLFNDLLFPLLGNFTHGGVVQTILALVPLLIGFLVVMFLVKGDRGYQERQVQPPLY